MKRIFNYIFVSALAFAASSCLNEKDITPDGPVAETGDEVKFGLSLASPETKTVYGDETENTDGKNVFPIYWTDGDKVQVFSPQCLEGYRAAEYKVILPDAGNAYYAKELVKTGETGIQWGSEATADFYSLYPSGSYKLSTDGKLAENIVIEYLQNIVVEGNTIKSDMESCLLYAKTLGAKKSEGVVNLHYDPISTVVMLTLKVAANELGTDADNFTIQSISLVAPEGTDIAGTFSLNIADGTFAGFSGSNSSNTVMAQIVNPSTNGLHTITNNEGLTVPLFLAPANYTSVKDWKVQVVANGNVYTKTLNLDKALEPGQIHKITLPELRPATSEWDVSKWMTYIPRNVYLSEISIPGSWNSINPDFQKIGNTDAKTIENQYKQGIRAFHLDTRWKAEYNSFIVEGAGTFKEVIGLGVADGGSTGSSWSGTVTDGDKYMKGSDTPLVEDIISQLVGYIKTTPEEYMVLVCSFAQESVEHNGANGWIKEISAICAKDEYKNYILSAQDIKPNTVVGDALGKIVVLIASSQEINENTVPSATLAENSKCFFSYLPMELKSTQFGDSAKNMDELWFTTATDTEDSGITLYNSHAQLTSSTGNAITNHERGYVPSDAQRTAVLNKILDWSKDNYGTDNYAHDKWIYLGLGGGYVDNGGGDGITSGSYDTIASKYNTWINGRVTEMGTSTPYYPVGIVLMNKVADYSNTVKDILLLNNKYSLQFDPSKPVDYNPNAKAASDYDASAPTGGSAF